MAARSTSSPAMASWRCSVRQSRWRITLFGPVWRRWTSKSRSGSWPRGYSVASAEEAERELQAVRRLGINLVALGEPEYPRGLQATDDAPPLLAVRGRLAVLAAPAVAMVGSRNA